MAMTAVTSRTRTPGRIALVALASILVASVGPASASAEGPKRKKGADTSSARLATLDLGPQAPWAVGLRSIVAATLEAADATVTANAAVPVEARAAGPGRRRALRPFSMNLYDRGDFVNQKTAYWCIPASTQTMINMMERGRPNRSRKLQARLYRIGDNLEEDGSVSRERERDRFRGMGISEWAGLLNRFGHGPYGLAGFKSRQNALRKAARMMRKTGKPVGLVVWRGAHAWVMSGFSATADPALTRDFTVTSVWVHDPWYPRVSSIWGRSRGPNQRVSPAVLGQDFVPYGRPGRRNPERDGRYMLVLPGTEPSPPDD